MGLLFFTRTNSAAIAQGSKVSLVRNAKHCSVKLRWLQQVVTDGDVRFLYNPASEQLAGFLTKPNDEITFLKFSPGAPALKTADSRGSGLSTRLRGGFP